MNKAAVIVKVSAESGVNEEDCTKVLKAFETVLSNELSGSKGVASALDKIQKVLGFFQNKGV